MNVCIICEIFVTIRYSKSTVLLAPEPEHFTKLFLTFITEDFKVFKS